MKSFTSTIINDALARKCFNSRGEVSVEVEIYTESGFGSFISPSGASKGMYEVPSFPSGGVDEALNLFEELVAPEIVGMDSINQFELDKTLKEIDGTPNFSKIGGSLAIATSIANATAAANSLLIPLYRYIGGVGSNQLPIPIGNVVGGGKHTYVKGLDIQEILIIPYGGSSFIDLALANIKVYMELIKSAPPGVFYGKNDEGALVTTSNVFDILNFVKKACVKVFEENKINFYLGLDVAATSLWNPTSRKYCLAGVGKCYTEDEFYKFIFNLIEEFNIFYIEDPFMENAFDLFARLREETDNCIICSDDLTATNVERIKYGASLKAFDAVIIKPNQVGTLTDALYAVRKVFSYGLIPICSHRSGDTPDVFLSHFAVATNSPMVKCGIVGGERISKINEFIRIEEDLGENARIAELEVLLK
ncbi:MAG: enolase [Candidatus Methanomethylicia archaeon]